MGVGLDGHMGCQVHLGDLRGIAEMARGLRELLLLGARPLRLPVPRGAALWGDVLFRGAQLQPSLSIPRSHHRGNRSFPRLPGAACGQSTCQLQVLQSRSRILEAQVLPTRCPPRRPSARHGCFNSLRGSERLLPPPPPAVPGTGRRRGSRQNRCSPSF